MLAGIQDILIISTPEDTPKLQDHLLKTIEISLRKYAYYIRKIIH